MNAALNDFLNFYTSPGVLFWLAFELFIFLIIFLFFWFCKKSSFTIIFDLFFEKVYEFFEDILWKWEQKWIKIYITIMFFIILLSNLFWIVLEFFAPIIAREVLEKFVIIPTADVNFNIAMAIIWVFIIIMEQFKTLWFWKTIYEYFPVLWKNLIPYERWKLPVYLDIPLFIIVKFFDILISLFLWLLDIVWHIAKVISLSFRLFWNMISWGILIWMLVATLSAMTVWILNIELPIIWPVLLYLQGLLVAFIQALVFPLLIAIFVKVAKLEQ